MALYNEPIHTLGARSTATSASEGSLKTDMVGDNRRKSIRKKKRKLLKKITKKYI